MPRNYRRRCAKGGARAGCAPKPDLSVYASSCDGLPLDSAWMNSSPSGNQPTVNQNNGKQVGGGYFLDVGAQLIGGQAPVGGYSECCPPVFKTTTPTATNGANGAGAGSVGQSATAGMGAGFSKSGVMLSNNGKPLCGGGNRNRNRNRKRKNRKSSKNRNPPKRKNSNKSRINKNSRLRRKTQKNKGSRNKASGKRSRNNRSRRRRRRNQTGGADGLPSVFTPDMTQRSFDCKQPDWGPKCI